MLDDFLIRAAIAGIGVAVAAGQLGCFVIWRRIAYFGDATAHAAVLGVALSLAFSVSTVLGVLVVAVAMALLVSTLSERGIGMDTLLGVMAQSGLALGLVAISFASTRSVDIEAYLFGELLVVTRGDLAVIWGWRLDCNWNSHLALDALVDHNSKPRTRARGRHKPGTRAIGAYNQPGSCGSGVD